MDGIVAFDTSCYTTSVALLDMSGRIVADKRQMLRVPQGQRGLRQSEGVYQHIRSLPELMEEAFAVQPGFKPVAVAASDKPRAQADSFMPVFVVGSAQARSLATALSVPVSFFSHQQGHVRAAMMGNSLAAQRYISLHLSGGTTEMLLCESESFTLLGATRDIAAGQLIDRVGVAMGLPFPSGRQLEALARIGVSESRLPTAMTSEGLSFHLSGAETQTLAWVQEKVYPDARIAAEIFDMLARSVAKMLVAGCRSAKTEDVLLAGGVASSLLFREMLTYRVRKGNGSIRLFFGEPTLSGDNAVGIGLLMLDQMQRSECNVSANH